MPEPEPRRLSDLEVTPDRVSLRVDGQAMEAVRVHMGANYVWRIRFADHRLSEQVFANAYRAVRWVAIGMPVDVANDVAPPLEERVPRRPERPRARTGFEPQPEEPDPEWLPLEWVSRLRSMPVPAGPDWVKIEWESKGSKLPASSLAAVPGAPTILEPAAFVRGRAAAPDAAQLSPAPEAVPSTRRNA